MNRYSLGRGIQPSISVYSVNLAFAQCVCIVYGSFSRLFWIVYLPCLFRRFFRIRVKNVYDLTFVLYAQVQ